MNILRNLYQTVIDALFPLSPAEEALLLLTPEEAFRVLPVAPAYDASVVPLPNTRSIFAYKDERVSRLVWNIKYKNNRHSVGIGGFALMKTLENISTHSHGPVLLIPIPTTPKRLRERGYNQCDLLIGEVLRLDTSKRFQTSKDLLVRIEDRARQKMKGRKDRLQSSKGIFAVHEEVVAEILEEKPNLKSRPIIVIDDVITTGSTMKEALDVLKAAGFSDVRGLALAH